MLKKMFAALVVMTVAACGTQADDPEKSAGGARTESSGAPAADAPAEAPAAAPDAAAAPADATATTAAPAAGAGAKTPAAAKSSPAKAAPSGGAAATPSQAAAPAAGGAPTPGDASAPPVPAAGGESPGRTVVTKGQGFSDTTIKIGATFPLSGALAFIGQQSAGAIDASVKMINARGGINGRKLQLISYDDGFDPGQVVGNVKRLWEQDKVAMVFAFVVDSANDYVKAKNIPFFTFGGSPGGFATKYPTIIPVGGSFLTWGQQVAHAVTKYMDRHPKVVAVMTDSVILNTQVTAKYIEDYWKKLGAERVIIEPVNMTQGDCSSQVLKYRQEGVEYWDWQSFAFVLCMPAMERLGWKPPLGQGGPVASMSVLSSAIGKSMEGVVAGAPADMFDGRPRFNGPTKGHLEYTEAIKKYQPGLNGPEHFNSPTTMAYWMASKFAFEGALMGAAEKYGELSSEAMLRWIYQAKNVDSGISTPIRGFAPDCKQGNNTTWWGLWKWDNAGQKLVNNPLTPHVDNSWYTDDPCFMTKVANEVVK